LRDLADEVDEERADSEYKEVVSGHFKCALAHTGNLKVGILQARKI
jgi:hypothetical protein